MRRAQSVRHYTRSSTSVAATGADDLGVLKEVPEESTEVTLRRQLLEKDKESDKVRGPDFSPQRMNNSSPTPRSSGIKFRLCRRSSPIDHQ
jgi:hypothetical protein